MFSILTLAAQGREGHATSRPLQSRVQSENWRFIHSKCLGGRPAVGVGEGDVGDVAGLLRQQAAVHRDRVPGQRYHPVTSEAKLDIIVDESSGGRKLKSTYT